MFRRTVAIVAVAFAAQVLGQLRGGGGFTCPEKNGRFPSPQQCDAYIECEEGVATEKLCPDGLLFNPKARFFAYPCQYPVNVDCEGRSALQPPQSTEDCPRQYGYFLRGDTSNCGKFVNCAAGVGYEFDCPEGLAFNADTLLCDWPDQVPTCDAEAFLGFRCPEPNGRYDDFQFFRSPADCQKYFICVNGRPRLYSCGDGDAFNEEFGGCDGIENVTACNNQQNLRLATTTAKPIGLPTQYQYKQG
ncbi:protein obstructor-E-like [Schistocerca serialis cubense]|uniref:protein obstructor-E-like n=1 Tax=Schistocerca serialis cubense TaxID=2023355 RepID=UPI00214EC41A|nr:protein obstructor-E-like [Schistocerca serialis cubense]